MSAFRFKRFSVNQERSALKVGTDAVLLGAAMTLPETASDILDVGTGTGVITLMVAQRLASRAEMARDNPGKGTSDAAVDVGWHITAIDIDDPSIDDARENFAASQWSERLEARCISLQGYSSECGEYDLVFSNPPFYDNSLKNPSARESAARHTTDLSWRDILTFAVKHLRESGSLSMILPAEDEKRLLRTAVSFGLYPFRILRISTVPSKPPRRIIAEFNFIRTSAPVESSIILNSGSMRSADYCRLTEDFYL